MVEQLFIGNRLLGVDRPTFIIAEAGVNHNGNVETALRLIDVAVAAGADAVKFQTFTANRLVTGGALKADYQQAALQSDESQLSMLRRLELSASAHVELANYAAQHQILFMSTPFDEQSADELDALGVPAFKLPSGEITNVSFLSYVARKGKPLIVSTGMANLGEVEAAVDTMEEAGNGDIILLHCVSNYPADPASTNLRAMGIMSQAFSVLTGYSDHTLGNEVALAAVALGACVIEKHFTLDHSLPGPDHQASAEPDQLAALVRDIRTVESALGNGRKRPVPSELHTAAVARKSLVAACDIAEGTILLEAHITLKRPGSGLPPSMRPHLLGQRARKSIAADSLLHLEHFT